MNSLLKEIDKRVAKIKGENEMESKAFTIRLSNDVVEDLEKISEILKLKRTELARMILTHGVKGLIEERGDLFSDKPDTEKKRPLRRIGNTLY